MRQPVHPCIVCSVLPDPSLQIMKLHELVTEVGTGKLPQDVEVTVSHAAGHSMWSDGTRAPISLLTSLLRSLFNASCVLLDSQQWWRGLEPQSVVGHSRPFQLI